MNRTLLKASTALCCLRSARHRADDLLYVDFTISGVNPSRHGSDTQGNIVPHKRADHSCGQVEDGSLRKAGKSASDELKAVTANIEQLLAAQKGIAESQKALLENNRAIVDRDKELMETIKAQGEGIQALQALIHDNSSQQS